MHYRLLESGRGVDGVEYDARRMTLTQQRRAYTKERSRVKRQFMCWISFVSGVVLCAMALGFDIYFIDSSELYLYLSIYLSFYLSVCLSSYKEKQHSAKE